MKKIKHLLNQISELTIAIGCSLWVLLPTNPVNMPFTGRDSGVFLYIGWRIINGELPYRDIWDHKPPVIFYLNALGLTFTNPSRWGVWIIEFLALLIAINFSYKIIRKIFGSISTIPTTFFWLFTLIFIIQGGNLTTEYTLPMQFAVLWLIIDIDKPSYSNSRFFLIGLLGGLSFLTKQTAIGLWVAILIYMIFGSFSPNLKKRFYKGILIILASSLIFPTFTILFFIAKGAFTQFWSASFVFNLVYSSSLGTMARISSFFSGIELLSSTGIFQISMIGYLITILLVIFRKSSLKKWSAILIIGLIDLPLELVLISISGYSYPHYYMTILPTLSLFTGVTFWIFDKQIASWGGSKLVRSVFSIGIILIFFLGSKQNYINVINDYKTTQSEIKIPYLQSITSPSDSVLMWGADAAANFFFQRKSPSRFVYLFPLYNSRYANTDIIEEFLLDIILNKPKFIIDTNDSNTPFLEFSKQSILIDDRINYIKTHYTNFNELGSWTIYEYDGKDP